MNDSDLDVLCMNICDFYDNNNSFAVMVLICINSLIILMVYKSLVFRTFSHQREPLLEYIVIMRICGR